MTGTSWSVGFHPACEAWANDLSQSDAEALLAAIRVLRERGPSLGRPLVDTVKTSRHPNMKELRPGSTGRTKIRVLFVFDTQRQAILLIGGDKSDNWTGWYKTNILIGDDRLDQHEAALAESRSAAKTAEQPATDQERKTTTMSVKEWEDKVLKAPGAAERVAEIEDELRLAVGLTALREQAGLSQRELAKRIGVSQPRIAAIEQSRNVTIEVLEHYVAALGGTLEVTVVKGTRKIPLLAARKASPTKTPTTAKASSRARKSA